jgi:hypothetical protein
MQSVHVDAPARLLGRIVDVDITEALPNSLHGGVATAICESGADSAMDNQHVERAAI